MDGKILVAIVLAGIMGNLAAPRRARAADDQLEEARRLLSQSHALSEADLGARGLPLAHRALQILEPQVGPDHLEVARALQALADLYFHQEEYVHAEPLYHRALRIREARRGPLAVEVAEPLHGLATLYLAQGRRAQAEPLFLRALRIRENGLGRAHPEVGLTLRGLASLYRAQGAPQRAAPLEQRALALFEAALQQRAGLPEAEVPIALRELASMYQARGTYDRAEPLYRRIIEILEVTQGKSSVRLATQLMNLGTIYRRQGADDRAEPLFLRALRLRERGVGPDHPWVASTLNNLAILYASKGAYARAEPLLLRALSIYEAASGSGSYRPDVAATLEILARVYIAQMPAQGAGEHAARTLQRALHLHAASAGPGQRPLSAYLDLPIKGLANPDYFANTLRTLAELLHRQGDHALSASSLRRAIAIRESLRSTEHSEVTRDRQLLVLSLLAQGQEEAALGILWRVLVQSEQRLRSERSSFSEGRLAGFLDLLRRQEEILYTLLLSPRASADVRRMALALSLLRKGRSLDELAALSRGVHLAGGATAAEKRHRLNALRSRIATLALAAPSQRRPLQALSLAADALEQDLARHARPALRLPSPADIVNSVAARLAPGEALLDIHAVRPLSFRIPWSADPHEAGRYLALLLLSDGRIASADLGPQAAIDAAVARLLGALSDPATAPTPSARELFERVLVPLLPFLGARRQVFLSADGQLNLVPFAALHDGQTALIDRYRFAYLTSGRDLLPRGVEVPAATSVALLADPAFAAPPGGPTAGATSRRERGLIVGKLAPLPGARQEVAAIHRLLPNAQVLLGAAASEPALLSLAAPGILHVATHGVFLADAPPVSASQRGFAASQVPPPHPLLRSALLLAGAASLATQAAPPLDQPDGLLTALEVAGMDLWGTQLVVLSACDSGKGVIKTGQGVYGLRRALMVAGAQTLVTSLWRVDDRTTRDLMVYFYEALLAGEGRGEALHQAAQRVRARRPHPYYWAPFIVLGNLAPLQGIRAAPAGLPGSP